MDSMYRTRMNSYYPEVIKCIEEFKAIIDSEYPEFDLLTDSKDKIAEDAYLLTMGEDRVAEWEKVLGIRPIEGSSISDRRDTIVARIRGQGKLNTALISSIVNAFTGGTANSYVKDSVLYVEITPPAGDKQFQFPNVEQELRYKVPAHLGFDISRNYYTWGEIRNEYGTWGTINAAFDTWHDVLLFTPFNSETVEVTGVVIRIADSVIAPLQGLTLYGQTTQDETESPTPDNPVELVSVENPSVTIHGKNLFDVSGAENYCFEEWDDGVCRLTRRNGQARFSNIAPLNIPAGTPVTISYEPIKNTTTASSLYFYYKYEDGSTAYNTVSSSRTSIHNKRIVGVCFYIRQSEEVDSYLEFKNLQIELGTTKSDYEPYTKQPILHIPHTLHGIPVTEGGNYTDANGQQWVTDEVDFERGVYIQRVQTLNLTELTEWHTWGVSYGADGITGFYHYMDGFEASVNVCVISNIASYNSKLSTGNNIGVRMTKSGHQYIQFGISNGLLADISSSENAVASFIELISTTNAVVLYGIDPIETALSTEEIEAYQALYTNNYNTVVVNYGNAPMVVKYKQVDKRS